MGAWMAGFTHPVTFTPDERSVLTTVARMLAQALSRAGAAETERELTDGLQRSMLPTLGPEIPGMTVAARYVPTGGGLQVGGDWYDMIALPSGRFALVIGDVQGHDVRAAGLMGQLRIALRAYASEGHPPDAVLSRASRFLHGVTNDSAADLTDLRFATCLYVEVDPVSGVLDIARAGHPDPAIRMADGTVLDPPDRGRPAPRHRPGRRLPHDPPRPRTRRDHAALHRRPDRDRRPRPRHGLAPHPHDPGILRREPARGRGCRGVGGGPGGCRGVPGVPGGRTPMGGTPMARLVRQAPAGVRPAGRPSRLSDGPRSGGAEKRPAMKHTALCRVALKRAAWK